jgi:hypothetical protein
MSGATTATTTATKPSACTCPVCQGLQLFSSPIYATGGVLTADDLSSEQSFMRAKMRLHNRHLHGWGTVCGLEVVCDDCAGFVRVLPGYAIDPCGNDLVLVDGTPFNLIKAIADCRMTRPKLGACDPYVPPPDPGCADTETYWCVTLRFNELQTAQTATLARQSFAPGGCTTGSTCSCGGMGGCTCGGSGGVTTAALAMSATPSSLLGYGLPGCSPRRLVECVEIGIVPHDGPCAPSSTFRRDPGAGLDVRGVGTASNPLFTIPPGSLLGRMTACWNDFSAIIKSRLTSADAVALSAINNGGAGSTPQAMHDALCRLRQAVLDFMMLHNPVRCQMLQTLGGIKVPDVTEGVSAGAYAESASPVFRNLLAIALQAFGDCICGTLLPQCPCDPTDMRVPIACVTVRGNQIVDICNHACRHYAGAFPSLFYWLSLVPIGPLVANLVALICCAPDAVSPAAAVVNRLMPMLDRMDVTGGWRRTLIQNGFSLPRTMLTMARNLNLGGLFGKVAPTSDPVAVATLVGQKQDEAMRTLQQQNVQVQIQEVADPNDATLQARSLLTPVVARGGAVTLYVHQGVVAGVGKGAVVTADVAALHQRIATLDERIANLERGAPR